MKVFFVAMLFLFFNIFPFGTSAQEMVMGGADRLPAGKHLFLDVHRMEPGKVKISDVVQAHAKDLVAEKKYGVHFLKYWVDEKQGMIFCLAESADSASIQKTHAEAHGLLPERIYPVTPGMEAALKGNRNLFLDIHYIGPGKVSAKNVAEAHQKDLAVQKKYGVNLTNYWLDEKEGVVMCLAEAKDSTALINTHKEAHGLVPDRVFKVKQGK